MNQQLQLPMPYALRLEIPAEAEPKAEPHRIELDLACARVFVLVRAAVETPHQGNLSAVTSAIKAAHKNLQTLNVVESQLATAI